MKLLDKFLILFTLGLFFGCISLLDDTIIEPPQVVPSCTNVSVQEPYMVEECQNVSRMEEVCVTRELNFSMSEVEETRLCVQKELCVNWLPDGTCVTKYCSKGMTRCKVNITNLDPQKAGEWIVSANFTVDGNTFKKNSIKKTMLPQESAVFNFEQFYDMDINQKIAKCKIFVSEPTKLQDCSFITKLDEECSNTTKYKEVIKQICE